MTKYKLAQIEPSDEMIENTGIDVCGSELQCLKEDYSNMIEPCPTVEIVDMKKLEQKAFMSTKRELFKDNHEKCVSRPQCEAVFKYLTQNGYKIIKEIK
jgi:hypothetical protein